MPTADDDISLARRCDIKPRELTIDEFDYPLPDNLIARHPLVRRDACRLLLRRHDGSLEHHTFTSLPELLPSGAMLVANNTRVINARLRFTKGESGARIEVFCLEPVAPADYERAFAATSSCDWLCFVGNSKRWPDTVVLTAEVNVDGHPVMLHAERIERRGTSSVVRLSWESADGSSLTFSQIIGAAGEIPIPPYLNRPTEESDSHDYQTVFSRIEGSVAAPTAGLHFTPELLDAIDHAGIMRREVTLHVGAGTFQPVKASNIGGHEMHSELIVVSRSLIAEIASATAPIIAVGTTSVRTLESLYHLGCMAAQGKDIAELPQWYAYDTDHPDLGRAEAFKALLRHLDADGRSELVASTRIIIAPGYRFRVVDGMVTNFHQPRSTLLLLVSAFTRGDWRRMYDEALEHRYNFLSYGDAQLLL